MTLTKNEQKLAKSLVAEAEKELKNCGINHEKYLTPKKPQTVNDILEKLLFHAQNGNGKYGIKFLEREKDLEKILYNFSPKEICKKYNNADEIWKEFPNDWKINAKGERRDWRLYSKTIFESAGFLKNFSSVKEINDTFALIQDKFGKYYLPQILMKIPGIKMAFSCDFLKETGFVEYAKPDTHITDIIGKLFFSNGNKVSEEDILKKVDEICSELKINQYHFDKLLYLVCTHDFYLDENSVKKDGSNLSSNKRQEFIDKIKIK